MNDLPIEIEYRTAYAPMYECYVRLTHAYTDDRGEWIFVGVNSAEGITGHLFRKCELENLQC